MIGWTEELDANLYGAFMWLVISGDENCFSNHVVKEMRQ
jgi:hypothetical protein